MGCFFFVTMLCILWYAVSQITEANIVTFCHFLIFATAMIKQFLNDVYWQDVDYLIIDTPPGTSDEHITVMEALRAYNADGAILVTTPQVHYEACKEKIKFFDKE